MSQINFRQTNNPGGVQNVGSDQTADSKTVNAASLTFYQSDCVNFGALLLSYGLFQFMQVMLKPYK